MARKQITKEKIIHSFLSSSSEKSPGATSLADISDSLEIKKASLYNHFSCRDEMYEATLEYCEAEIINATFITEKNLETAAEAKTQPAAFIKKLISRYFKLFDTEPFLPIYVFINSEKYFNGKAFEIAENLNKKLISQMKSLLKVFIDLGKIKVDEKEEKEIPVTIISLMENQLDLYIAEKKETIRMNPETGAGSLFATPSDDSSLQKYLRPLDTYLKVSFTTIN